MNKIILLLGLLLLISCQSVEDDLIRIKLIGVVQHDYQNTNMSFESELVCNLNTGMCGNSVNYETGKGFFWSGLHNSSGLEVSASLMKQINGDEVKMERGSADFWDNIVEHKCDNNEKAFLGELDDFEFQKFHNKFEEFLNWLENELKPEI